MRSSKGTAVGPHNRHSRSVRRQVNSQNAPRDRPVERFEADKDSNREMRCGDEGI